jgi:hypothetical protein
VRDPKATWVASVVIAVGVVGALTVAIGTRNKVPVTPEPSNSATPQGRESEGPTKSHRVEFRLDGDADLRSVMIPVAMWPLIGGKHSGAANVVSIEVDSGGQGFMSVPEGDWEVWIGSVTSPSRAPPFTVPCIVRISSGGPQSGPLHAGIQRGGAISVPSECGVPSASGGRRSVVCRSVRGVQERWLVVGPPGYDDMVWPPLPPGDWSIGTEGSSGKPLELTAEVIVDRVAEATVKR